MNKFNLKNKTRGFTLVETLVAISIFTTSILALIGFIAQGSANTHYSQNKIIAEYLAQEGVEYMRNMRDTYVLFDSTSSQHGWQAYLTKTTGGLYPSSSNCASANGCYFDDSQSMTGSSNIVNCGSSCPALLYNSGNGTYGYSSGSSSGFIRKIKISYTNADRIKLLSTVSWTDGVQTYSVTFSEDMFNWIE